LQKSVVKNRTEINKYWERSFGTDSICIVQTGVIVA